METILFDYDEIQREVQNMGIHINNSIKHCTEPPILMGVLDGCFRFYSDLMKHIDQTVICDFIKVSSYKGKEQEEMKIHKFPKFPLRGKTVILIDDILDSGNTINYIIKKFKERGVKEIVAATLLRRKTSPELDISLICGFDIDDEWVAGYGLDDLDGTGRNKNYIYKIDNK